MTSLRARRCALPLLAVILTAACSGPQQRLDFGGKAVPINVAFGKPAADQSPEGEPEPALLPVPGGVGVVPFLPGSGGAPRRPRPEQPPTVEPAAPPPVPEPRPSCAPQDPFAFPRVEATNVVQGEVPEGTFPFRTVGTYTVNGEKTSYDEQVVQTVRRDEPDPQGRRRFFVEYTLLGVPYTVSYAVQAPVDAVVDAVPGEIGLAAIVRESEDGNGASFRPTEPLRLLQLRAERGDTWTEASTDPLSGSSGTVDGVIEDKVNINACGQPVNTWKSVVTQRIVTPLQDITATRTLHFATGYGGLLVAEEVSFAGRAGADTVSGTSSMTINVDPGA